MGYIILKVACYECLGEGCPECNWKGWEIMAKYYEDEDLIRELTYSDMCIDLFFGYYTGNN